MRVHLQTRQRSAQKVRQWKDRVLSGALLDFLKAFKSKHKQPTTRQAEIERATAAVATATTAKESHLRASLFGAAPVVKHPADDHFKRVARQMQHAHLKREREA
jgi:hypothetical protein